MDIEKLRNKKVKIKNLVSQRVLLSVPELRLRRVWEKKGAVMTIPFDQLEEAIYSPGVENLFTEGILGIDDMEVKIALGLEPEDAVAPVNIITLSDAEMQRYLTVMPAFEFKEKVRELPYQQVMELANYAIAHEIANFEKAEILKQLINIDIMSAIKLNRDDMAVQEG